MRLTTGAKLKVIGTRMATKFGAIDFALDATPLFGKRLPANMTNEEIEAQYNPTEVGLGQLANYLSLINQGNQYVFYIKDGSNLTRAVSIFFVQGDGWTVVSPNVDESNYWQANSLLLSSTAI